MGRWLRERIVAELAQRYKDTDYCVFVDFSGLDVQAMGTLRQRMRDNGVEFEVVKNSLLKLALEKVGLPTTDRLFVRPTAVVTGGEDVVAICKIVVDWHGKTKTTKIKGGILELKLVTEEQVLELSKLPPRDTLMAQVLAVFVAPLTNIASLLNNTLGQIANLMVNHIEKLEKVEN